MLGNLHLHDVSSGGLSADCGQELPVALPVLVALPPRVSYGGHWTCRHGRIVRCRPSTVGFRVGIAFDPPPAAAG